MLRTSTSQGSERFGLYIYILCYNIITTWSMYIYSIRKSRRSAPTTLSGFFVGPFCWSLWMYVGFFWFIFVSFAGLLWHILMFGVPQVLETWLTCVCWHVTWNSWIVAIKIDRKCLFNTRSFPLFNPLVLSEKFKILVCPRSEPWVKVRSTLICVSRLPWGIAQFTIYKALQNIVSFIGLFCKRAIYKALWSEPYTKHCEANFWECVPAKTSSALICLVEKAIYRSLLQKSPIKETIFSQTPSKRSRASEKMLTSPSEKTIELTLLQKSPIKETIFYKRDLWYKSTMELIDENPYGVTTFSRLLKSIGLFCKRAL